MLQELCSTSGFTVRTAAEVARRDTFLALDKANVGNSHAFCLFTCTAIEATGFDTDSMVELVMTCLRVRL